MTPDFGEGFAYFCWRRLKADRGEGCCLENCYGCMADWENGWL